MLNGDAMKYFFLSDGWTTGRVWEFGGLWNERAWHREPHLQKQSLCIKENNETLCLYAVEDAVLMVEVMPEVVNQTAIGQVVLKRLLTADQMIERLCKEESIFYRQRASDSPSHQPPLNPQAPQNSELAPQTSSVDESGDTLLIQPATAD
ncbi:MAG: hypothetical protein WBC73_10645 [Phormidesmis sp.]